MKLPRRTFSASGRGRRRAPGRIADRKGANLSDAAGAHNRRLFAPAGATDITARLMGQWLSERLGQQFVIENRPGAGSNIGTEAVVHAPPDGYTLLHGHAAPYDQRLALRQAQLQFPPRHRAGRGHHPHAPRHGGQSIGPGQDGSRVHRLCQGQSGQDQHGIGRQRNAATRVRRAVQDDGRRQHGSRALSRRGARADRSARRAGAGDVHHHALLDRVHQSRQAARARGDDRDAFARRCRTCRPWAISCRATRRAHWYGIGAPSNTPAEIVDKLNREINAGLADPKIKARLAELGGTALAGSPADFGKLIADETEKWAKVVKFSGAKPD